MITIHSNLSLHCYLKIIVYKIHPMKTLAVKAGRSWLNATLTVKSSKLITDEAGEVIRPGLPASGMFVINPPHTLKALLQASLPQMVALLAQDRNAGFTLDHGG